MLLKDILPASFRGARFLVPQDTAEFGRNAIRHAYPDGSYHYIEDNGINPPEFKITAVLAEPGLVGKWRALQSALSRPGPGLLKHPYWGNQFVMVHGKARVKRDDKEAGTLEIEIPFSVTGPPALPGIVSGVAAYVTGLVTSVLTAIFSEFSSGYATPSSPGSAVAVGETVESIGNVFDSVFGSASSGGTDLAWRSVEVGSDPERFVSIFGGAISAVREDDDNYPNDKVVSGCSSLFVAASQLITDLKYLPADTYDRIRRRETITSLATAVEAVSFCVMAEAMAARTYDTADDIDRDHESLADFLDVLQGRQFSGDVHAELLRVFNGTSDILEGQAVRRPRVVPIRVTPVPSSVLAYELYESDANVQQIVTLNLDQPPILMTQDVNVLMEA